MFTRTCLRSRSLLSSSSLTSSSTPLFTAARSFTAASSSSSRSSLTTSSLRTSSSIGSSSASSSFISGNSFRSFSSDPDSHDDFKPVVKKPAASSSSSPVSPPAAPLSSSSSSSASTATPALSAEEQEAVNQIQSDVESHPVFVFMKGTPDAPRCGFSANVVKLLKHLGAEFSARDVLEDDRLRAAVKSYSDWPTLPQLYVKGEFVGGSDIVTTLFKNGELEKLLTEAGAIKQKAA